MMARSRRGAPRYKIAPPAYPRLLPRLLYRDSYRGARRGDVQYEYEEALYVQEDGWMAARPDARAVYRRGVGAAFDGQRTAVAEEHTCTTCALASRRAWPA